MFSRLAKYFRQPAPAKARYVTIPPYDPRIGPQITNDMWTEEMLTGELTPTSFVTSWIRPDS